MRKQNTFGGFLLLGIGLYFLMRQLQLPIITHFYSWPTLVIIIGIAFLIQSYSSKQYENLFPGVVLLGLGIHFHGMNVYSFWIQHWGVYPFIISIAFLVRYTKTKSGFIPGLFLLILSMFALFSTSKPEWFQWIDKGVSVVQQFWPVILIGLGCYLLFFKKK
ncbi:hypothetical protein N781_10455 [Pontibacillus halophilus JSM 076056 = DSM 19796]|uniref:LiaI-LiaF-like transmembrane region domain-containing protein n=1 Tax=Pontibacillus halophilus JSM 076056 = DSM 19796 TaxID=1385510 RepID=A0A0A5GJN9_9BACI|nr:DUF5668 domain-containing protein [Pontibacillus halophilus]KGX93461.1 hypothetical protein N781_10455 [Pontibacillus halophilus JSM 076056 = DSM 19796]